MKGQSRMVPRLERERVVALVTALTAAVASALVASLALAWSAEVELTDTAPATEPKQQAEVYLKARSELTPKLVWSREELEGARAADPAGALELSGVLAGMAWCGSSGQVATLHITLELEGGGSIGLQAPAGMGELRVGEPLCVIAQAGDSGGVGQELWVKAWVSPWDLPPEARPRSGEQPAPQPASTPGGAQPSDVPPPPDIPPLPEGPAARPDAVAVWRDYVLQHNPKLTSEQAEAIVRWVLQAAAQHNVNHKLIFAVIKWESWFDPSCVSHAGAIGLMQLMPGTARGLGLDPWDVQQNIEGGVRYLAEQLAAYADRPNQERVILALASYNAGPNAVKRAGGVPNIYETQRYVRKVSKTFWELHQAGYP